MKHNYLAFIVFIAWMACSCDTGDVKLGYEPGMYIPYKQDISPIYAITGNKTIDGDLIKWGGSLSGKKGDIHFVDMNPSKDPLREPEITINRIHLEKGNSARVFCPTCLDRTLQIRVKDDSLFMTPKNLKDVVKFAPYIELGISLAGTEEAERYATLQCKTFESGLILSSYNIFVLSSSFRKGAIDAYYLDIGYLKKELKDNDTLVYVKKETYFRKQ